MDYEKLIKDALEKTKDEIQQLKELAKPVSPDNAIGRLSRMEAISEKSIHEAALRQSELRVVQLEQALKRLADDEFGICLSCEEEISAKRLKVIPEASLCINCANKKQG